MKRIVTLLFTIGLIVVSCDQRKKDQPRQPNILLIISDQLNWDFFSAVGNEYVHTPNIDRLIKRGVRFDRSYAINPVCIPSRVSMFTGQRPTYFGFHIPKGIENEQVDVRAYVKSHQIANELKTAGYQAYYGGKDHFGWRDYAFKPEDLGFEVYSNGKEYRGVDCVPKAIATLKRHREEHSGQPFFMVTSLMNPHDICYAHIRDNQFDLEKINERTDGGGWQDLLRESVLANLRIPEGETGAGGFEPINYYLDNAPPLPDNYLPQSDEPSVISGIGEEDKGMAASFGRYRGQYDSIDWRLHRFAYVKFVEEIDREVGELLAGLEEAGYDDTYIIFTSDHGEQNGAHQMAGKGFFYDEACHVPFIVSHPDFNETVDSTNLVSNGLDLLPTIFGLAGVQPKVQYEGKDISRIFLGQQSEIDRSYIPVEFSTGMGIVSKDFYYGIYYNGKEHNEQLYDMRKRPLQMVNDALDSTYQKDLTDHRVAFGLVNEQTLSAYKNPEGFYRHFK
ncbi:MAG: sulfatase-like hydrolase/transferase [Marinoscillum sp.]|uniref:sulfatase family protein n=1 Tax=Marinoscillum sp. TaxID=2024838 RepID=UPI003303EE1F